MDNIEIRPDVVAGINIPRLYDYKGVEKFVGTPGQTMDQLWNKHMYLNPYAHDTVDLYNPALEGIDVSDIKWCQRDYGTYKDVISLGYSLRGYLFIVHRIGDTVLIMAGCRRFTLEEARNHWYACPDELAKVKLGEKIATELGWIQPVLEPQITAGELACETTPTVVVEDEEEKAIQNTFKEMVASGEIEL